MTDPRDPATTEAHLDDLRRRLYRADATDDDLRRYLEERPPEAPARDERGPTPDPRSAPPHRRPLVLGVALVAAAAITTGIVVGTRPAASTDVAGPAPSRTAATQELQRTRVRTLDGPTPVAVSIDGTAAVGQRFQGYGTAVVAVDHPDGSEHGGHAYIDVTSADPALVEWRALLLIRGEDGDSSLSPLAQGPAEDRSGAHAPITFIFADRPLTQVAIEAPADVNWTLVVAVRGPSDADLR